MKKCYSLNISNNLNIMTAERWPTPEITADGLIQQIESDQDLKAALEDLEAYNSNISREFFKFAPATNLPKILEVVQKNAKNRKELKGKEQISARTRLEEEMVGLLE